VRSYRDGQGVDPTGTTAWVVFTAYNPSAASNPTVTVNGHAHPMTLTESLSHSYADAIPIPITDLVSGNNTITFSGFAKTGNVDVVVAP